MKTCGPKSRLTLASDARNTPELERGKLKVTPDVFIDSIQRHIWATGSLLFDQIYGLSRKVFPPVCDEVALYLALCTTGVSVVY